MKKIIILSAFLFLTPQCYADDAVYPKYEHLFEEEKCSCNQVIIDCEKNILCKGNILEVEFECPYKSECSNAGDKVTFLIKDAVYTKEGTLLIPANSKILATVIKIKKQRVPNKNARVYFSFNCLETPDGTLYDMKAVPNTKDASLKEGPWMTTGKLVSYTLGFGIIGAGAGTGFAFIPNPAKLGAGFAIGIPVGTSVGLITGLITPGLKYHAKQGEEIKIILCDNLELEKQDDECECIEE